MLGGFINKGGKSATLFRNIGFQKKFFEIKRFNSNNSDERQREIPKKFKVLDDKKSESIDHSTTYQFPKNPKYNIPLHVLKKSNDNFLTRHKRFLPIVIAVAIGGWGLYTVYFFTNPEAGKAFQKKQELLSEDYFTEFVITNRRDIDEEHFIIELTPKSKDDIKHKYFLRKGFWDGSRLWSVEVKQPEIMVVRKYTPLPLILEETLNFDVNGDESKSQSKNPTLRISNDVQDAGKMCLYIKKYEQGEVARWISKKPVGSTLELRGPYTEYEFEPQEIDKHSEYERPKMNNIPSKVSADPYLELPSSIPNPNNLVFFGAGTGIAPVLQLLLSENPYKGYVFVNYSFRDMKEVPEEFLRFFFFLQKMDRISLTTFNLAVDEYITEKDVMSSSLKNRKPKDLKLELELQREKLVERKMKELTNKKTKYANSTESTNVVDGGNQYGEEYKIDNMRPVNSSSDNSKLLSNHLYKNALQQGFGTRDIAKADPSLALVCGPEGYIAAVSGPKPNELLQGVVGGFLGEKGWDESNVFKM